MRTSRSVSPRRPGVALAALAGALVAAPAAATAQDVAAPDARWQAWYGCWTAAPVDSEAPTAAPHAPVVCVTPAGGSAVEVTTVAEGKVVERDRLDAGGAPRALNRDGCAGSERAAWSADGRRVFVTSDLTCTGGARRAGTAVLAISGDRWVDVRTATVQGHTEVRSLSYRPTPEPFGLPADVRDVLRGRALAVSTTRIAAGAPLTVEAVVEANRAVGAQATSAWLAESRQRFTLDARQLTALADAGVPGTVTDVMIAVSHPGVFALGPAGTGRTTQPGTLAVGRPGPVVWALSPGYGGAYGWSPFGGYGYNAWNYGYGPGFGYGAGGFFPGGYWGSGPVVIVRPGVGGTGQRATLTRGRGYSQGSNPSQGSAGSPRNDAARTSSSGSWSSGGSSGGSASGSSGGSMGRGGYSGGGSSSGGTAKPRSPQ